VFHIYFFNIFKINIIPLYRIRYEKHTNQLKYMGTLVSDYHERYLKKGRFGLRIGKYSSLREPR